MRYPAQSDTEIYFNLPAAEKKILLDGNISTLQRKVSPFVFVSSLPWQQKLMTPSIFPPHIRYYGWKRADSPRCSAVIKVSQYCIQCICVCVLSGRYRLLLAVNINMAAIFPLCAHTCTLSARTHEWKYSPRESSLIFITITQREGELWARVVGKIQRTKNFLARTQLMNVIGVIIIISAGCVYVAGFHGEKLAEAKVVRALWFTSHLGCLLLARAVTSKRTNALRSMRGA